MIYREYSESRLGDREESIQKLGDEQKGQGAAAIILG
jgi:hypothetical protein